MSARRRRLLEGARDSFVRPSVPDETAWLIERGQAVNHTPTIWWSGPDSRPFNDYPQFWTTDANTARRFATKEAAAGIAEKLFGFGGRDTYTLTEHVFIGSATALEHVMNELYARAVAMHESIAQGRGAVGWEDETVRNLLRSYGGIRDGEARQERDEEWRRSFCEAHFPPNVPGGCVRCLGEAEAREARIEIRLSDIELLRKPGPLTDRDREALRDLGRRLANEALRRIDESKVSA